MSRGVPSGRGLLTRQQTTGSLDRLPQMHVVAEPSAQLLLRLIPLQSAPLAVSGCSASVHGARALLAAKRMVVSRGKIPERHSKRATDFRVQLMHCARKAIGREPFRQRIRFDECAIDLLWPGCQHTMQTNSIGHTYFSTEISWIRYQSECSLRPTPLCLLQAVRLVTLTASCE
jgi:hypothetical protein